MIFWLDAQLSAALAVWLRMRFSLGAIAVREVGLRDAGDEGIYAAARTTGVIVTTKGNDFIELLQRPAPPPQALWLRCRNTSRG